MRGSRASHLSSPEAVSPRRGWFLAQVGHFLANLSWLCVNRADILSSIRIRTVHRYGSVCTKFDKKEVTIMKIICKIKDKMMYGVQWIGINQRAEDPRGLH